MELIAENDDYFKQNFEDNLQNYEDQRPLTGNNNDNSHNSPFGSSKNNSHQKPNPNFTKESTFFETEKVSEANSLNQNPLNYKGQMSVQDKDLNLKSNLTETEIKDVASFGFLYLSNNETSFIMAFFLNSWYK